tara:strand:+ start:5604 stop:5720 length:117 start_codon:yes stop_codon:yes gene_type:complete
MIGKRVSKFVEKTQTKISTLFDDDLHGRKYLLFLLSSK